MNLENVLNFLDNFLCIHKVLCCSSFELPCQGNHNGKII